MNPEKQKAGTGLVGLGLTLGISLIVSTLVLSATFHKIRSQNQIIEVKGFAQKTITSDWAIWDCSFHVQSKTLQSSYQELEAAREQVIEYLLTSGATESDLDTFPLVTRTNYVMDANGRRTEEVSAYAMSQNIRVSGKDIDLIKGIAKNSSALVKQGIYLSASSPSYHFTRFDELKIEMLGQAMANARQRAEEIAKQGKSGIGELRYARQGVFQITPVWSTTVSDYGQNDTTSIEKRIKAIVTTRFAIQKQQHRDAQ